MTCTNLLHFEEAEQGAGACSYDATRTRQCPPQMKRPPEPLQVVSRAHMTLSHESKSSHWTAEDFHRRLLLRLCAQSCSFAGALCTLTLYVP